MKPVNDNLPVVWDSSYEKMMTTLRRYVTQLQSTYPVDQMGRPTALVNPQTILSTGFLTPIDDLIDHPPEGTELVISYLEGLPTIDGVPIWERIEGEKTTHYDLFKRYRSMKDAKTQRAVYKLAVESGMETRHLEMLRQIYHWNARVLAYDNYLAQERAVQLELRRLEIEGKHANTAQSLYKISATYLEQHSELLTPKLALQMLEMSIRLERMSVGMNPDSRKASDMQPTVNIQNNIGSGGQPDTTAPTLITGRTEDDRTRLMQVLNVMNNIGLIKEEEEAAPVAVDIIPND